MRFYNQGIIIPKNKKEVTEQCELSEDTPREINEKFESNSIKKLVRRALANQRVKKEYIRIKTPLEKGINPLDNLSRDLVENRPTD